MLLRTIVWQTNQYLNVLLGTEVLVGTLQAERKLSLIVFVFVFVLIYKLYGTYTNRTTYNKRFSLCKQINSWSPYLKLGLWTYKKHLKLEKSSAIFIYTALFVLSCLAYGWHRDFTPISIIKFGENDTNDRNDLNLFQKARSFNRSDQWWESL